MKGIPFSTNFDILLQGGCQMNWKNEAVERLKRYEAMRACLSSLPKELARLEEDAGRIRSAGDAGQEDALLSNRVCYQELQGNLNRAKLWLAGMDKALGVLSRQERRILERFYIQGEKGAAGELAKEMFVDIKTVYRRKDEAIRKFTLALYGGIDSAGEAL